MSMLAACSPDAFVDIEVVHASGQPPKGVALSVHDGLTFKFRANADAQGCINARAKPTRWGGRDWRMSVESPSTRPAEFRMHAAGRQAFIVTLQPEGSDRPSSVLPVDRLPRCQT